MTQKLLDGLTEDKKVAILKAATSLFARFGFGSVGIRKIADEAGCNMAAISYYFGGKEKLYQECLNSLDPKYLEEMADILIHASDRSDLEAKLHSFCVSFCQLAETETDLIRLVVGELNACSNSERVGKTVITPILDTLDLFFLNGIQQKILKDDIDTKLLAKMFICTIVAEVIYTGHENFTFEKFAQDLIKNCTGSIYA